MMVLAIIAGVIVGALVFRWEGALAGGFTAMIAMLAWRSYSQTRQRGQPARAQPAPGGASGNTVEQRMAAIEARLAALERGSPVSQVPATPVPPAIVIDVPPAPIDTLPGTFVRTPQGTLEPVQKAPAPEPAAVSPSRPVPAPNPVWAWFTGGNALTRIGVIALFFGVGFLLKYLSEIVTFPIELKLSGIALVGVALVMLGTRLGGSRPGYGLSLQGAGAGILYLTTFAAFRLYDVLPAPAAFVLLIAVAALTVWLALRNDSQPLAALAIAGGFLAPFLVATTPRGPTLLFGYFLVLNAAILVLAWLRPWRALNVLGFVFTFALGLFWGERYYRPEYFSTVEPFLVVFFLFYVAIAVLFAKRGALAAKAPVDAVLVFGVPLVAFALQAALVHDTRYGVASSAVAMAVVYAVLAFALQRRSEEGFPLLSRAFLVLAVIFATIAVPFAVDPQWTSAWWALEAAGVYWIGCRQRQTVARVFALVLQAAAGVAFALGDFAAGAHLFLNATFTGAVLIAVAALATTYVADRHRDDISANERSILPALVIWAIGWWYGGGAWELTRALPSDLEGNAILAYAVVTVACTLVATRLLDWKRLAWFGAGLLPVMAIVAVVDWDRRHTTLFAYGWLVWPIAWLVHWQLLRMADNLREEAPVALRVAHATSAIALVAWVAWEASEWVGRVFPAGTVWVACAAALPAIAFLFATPFMRSTQRWPFAAYRDAYATSAATTIAALLAVWFLVVNVMSPGSAAPLPYVPVVNPLDFTLIAALVAMFVWAQPTLRVEERTLYYAFGAALFLLVNAIVFRAVHQWLDVPWRMSALVASKPLQAALTLTWTATALPLMIVATRRAIRPLWMIGAALLAVVVFKLFLIDLGALSGLPRIAAFLGVGALLLLIGYLAPLPPSVRTVEEAPEA